MRVVFRNILILVALLAAIAVSDAMAGELDELRELQRGLKSVRASFLQVKTTELLGRPIKSRGEFYMKAHAGVRWDYKDSMVVIFDGRDLFLHYIEMEEAEQIRGASGYVGPLVFDVDKLHEKYRVTAMKLEGDIKLTLKPREDAPFERMEMIFAAGSPFPEKIVVLEPSGDKTVIEFIDVKTGVKLSSDLFIFTPPPGVNVRYRYVK
jgi:outer membrane lipoprotein carrier protein